MKRIVLTFILVFSVLLPIGVFADDLSLKFDSYGWYEDDINKDDKKEKIWIVPIGGSYRVDKENSSIDMNSFFLSYELVEVLPEPEYIKGRPIYSYNISIGTMKDLEWYGSLCTFVGSGEYAGPDTEYYFDRTEMIYVDMGSKNDDLSFGDLAAGIFSGNYPMTDPVPKDFYCITALKKGTAEELKAWYFKVLPYEYAAPANVSATVCGRDVTFNAYNIKGSNYFRIRDLAAAFKGTGYAFSVEPDQMGGVRIRRGKQCSDVISAEGMGMVNVNAVHSNGGIISFDDEKLASKSVECYSINGYNHYKIRDIAAILGFEVIYDSATGRIECR